MLHRSGWSNRSGIAEPPQRVRQSDRQPRARPCYCRTMLRTVVVGGALALVGCGAADDPSCGFEERTYLSVRTRLNGNCPELEPTLAMPGDVPPECTQRVTYSADCGVQTSRSCILDGVRVRAVSTLTARGDGYEGLSDYVILDPAGDLSCTGLYRVTLTAE